MAFAPSRLSDLDVIRAVEHNERLRDAAREPETDDVDIHELFPDGCGDCLNGHCTMNCGPSRQQEHRPMTSLSEQIARDMREGTFPKKSETTQAEDRARVSYDAFRNGFDGGVLPPEWEKAPSWIRDAIHVAYLQGKLDGSPAKDSADIAGLRPKIEHELDEMMIGAENYFGAQNPKRSGHIRCALDRIMKHLGLAQ